MKVVFFLLALMFMSFASLQLNDPDPILWILIYGLMAVVCVMAAFRYYLRKLMIVMSVAYIGVASTLLSSIVTWAISSKKGMLFDDLAKMEHPYIEESREFLGLLICLIVLTVCWILSIRQKRNI